PKMIAAKRSQPVSASKAPKAQPPASMSRSPGRRHREPEVSAHRMAVASDAAPGDRVAPRYQRRAGRDAELPAILRVLARIRRVHELALDVHESYGYGVLLRHFGKPQRHRVGRRHGRIGLGLGPAEVEMEAAGRL